MDQLVECSRCGAYLARFTANDANGNVRLGKVNKLLLTK